MTSNLLEFLQSKNIYDLIGGEEREITRNYLSFLQQTPRATIENESDYIELKQSIDAVKQLQRQTIQATRDLRTAHRKLLQELKNKKSLKQSIKELQQLYEEIKDLKETVQTIEANN